ncbi:helix-turn-helix domain-containing protein [Streptomyces mirabilis]|uniref:helix-turn-helix domain-containing protein n=1 Tax=Streptomyces mirabilis TaxID=68239 RepID=UPI003650A318
MNWQGMHGSCRRRAQEALRMRAVAALVAGRDREDVAELFKVSFKTVDNWGAKCLTGGREALASQPTSQPAGRRAGEHQLLGEAEQQVIRQAMRGAAGQGRLAAGPLAGTEVHGRGARPLGGW